jgi:hypothetical protein
MTLLKVIFMSRNMNTNPRSEVGSLFRPVLIVYRIRCFEWCSNQPRSSILQEDLIRRRTEEVEAADEETVATGELIHSHRYEEPEWERKALVYVDNDWSMVLSDGEVQS